jgi:hypothetical protein
MFPRLKDRTGKVLIRLFLGAVGSFLNEWRWHLFRVESKYPTLTSRLISVAFDQAILKFYGVLGNPRAKPY